MVQTYELKNSFNDENLSCYLDIINEYKYCIYFIKGPGDDRLILFLSFGVIQRMNKNLYLKDVRSNSTLILQEENDVDLSVKKGFTFMCEKSFIYIDESDSFIYDPILNIPKESEERRVKVKKYLDLTSLDRVPLQLGTYSNGYVYLDINMNFKFKIYYLVEKTVYLLSDGKWKKEGNKLWLYDSSLDYSFLLLIDLDSLISIHFPNEINESDRYILDENSLYPFIMR